MGCRTRVFENVAGEKSSLGRGNLSFTTLNMPRLAIEARIKDGNLDYGQKSFLMTGADPVPESSCELYELFRDGTFLLYGGGTDHVAKNRQVLEELLLKEITDFTLEERKGCLVFVDGEFWGLYLVICMPGNADNDAFDVARDIKPSDAAPKCLSGSTSYLQV